MFCRVCLCTLIGRNPFHNIFLSVIRFIIIQRSAFLPSALRAAAASRPFRSGFLAPPPHPIKRVGAVASASVSFRDGIASRFGFTLQIHTTSNFTFWQVFFTDCNLTETLRQQRVKYYRKMSRNFIYNDFHISK